jgi:hypothetical protein
LAHFAYTFGPAIRALPIRLLRVSLIDLHRSLYYLFVKSAGHPERIKKPAGQHSGARFAKRPVPLRKHAATRTSLSCASSQFFGGKNLHEEALLQLYPVDLGPDRISLGQRDRDQSEKWRGCRVARSLRGICDCVEL